jgi:hypothetical protein
VIDTRNVPAATYLVTASASATNFDGDLQVLSCTVLNPPAKTQVVPVQVGDRLNWISLTPISSCGDARFTIHRS